MKLYDALMKIIQKQAKKSHYQFHRVSLSTIREFCYMIEVQKVG